MTRRIISNHDINKIKSLPIEEQIEYLNGMGITTPDRLEGVDPQKIEEIVNKVSETPDKYSDKLIKYIPAEVITLFMVINPLLITYSKQKPESGEILHWFIFCIFLILTPLYLWRVEEVNNPSQLMISTLAFGTWVFGMGGPFTYIPFYVESPLLISIFVPLIIFSIPLIDPKV
jgi:hypothetical protein